MMKVGALDDAGVAGISNSDVSLGSVATRGWERKQHKGVVGHGTDCQGCSCVVGDCECNASVGSVLHHPEAECMGLELQT